MPQESFRTKQWPGFGVLIPAIILVMPLAMKPDEFRYHLTDREKYCPNVFVGGSAQGIEVGEGCAEEFVSRPVSLLACC